MTLILVTYGAPNFIIFLLSFIIGIGITIIDRTYVSIVVEITTKMLEAWYRQAKIYWKLLLRIMNVTEDNEEEDEESLMKLER